MLHLSQIIDVLIRLLPSGLPGPHVPVVQATTLGEGSTPLALPIIHRFLRA